MNKKTIPMIIILALGTMLMVACVPVTPVASAMDAAAQSETDTANTTTENQNGNGQGMMQSNGECDGTCENQGEGHNGGGHHGETGSYPNYAVSELSEAEVDGLAFMREEEKLARDVYLTLYETWELRPFSNIAKSEQTHTDTIKYLLDKYELPDPVIDDSIGVFANEDLQTLYDELIEKGNTSLVDAIEVSAAVEEIDILDLIEYLEGTDDPNLEWVYENLKAGSENHLRAFARQYEMQTGEAYEPQYLTQEMYDEIISASNGQGGGPGHGGGRGNGGGGNGHGNGQGQNG